MILGQAVGYFGEGDDGMNAPTPESRIPFRRPQAAGFYQPDMPRTAFFSHLRPFQKVMLPMIALPAGVPGMPQGARPGNSRRTSGTSIRQQLPDVAVGPGGETEQSVGPVPGVNGAQFGATSFGRGVSPYRTIRTGMYPGIQANGNNIRAGVDNAGRIVRQNTPGAFPNQNDPAGNY